MESISCLAQLAYAFAHGAPVGNIECRSCDAPYILEPEEYNLEWREMLFPPSSLPVAPVLRPQDFALLLKHEASLLTLRSPPLVLLAPDEISILDGWHRIAAAQSQQAPLITLLAAKVPKIYEV
jgi:hypothetical protein